MVGRFATSPDGIPIAYDDAGSGSPALVFVHGWSCDRSYWRHQLPAFEEYSMKGRTYRYFTGDALWGFGFGLSYSKFAYTGLRTQRTARGATVSVRVKNESSRDGDEVVQLYVAGSGGSGDPVRTLRGFQRVTLEAGECRRVRFQLTAEQLAFTGADYRRVVEPGDVTVQVGTSSADLALSVTITLTDAGRLDPLLADLPESFDAFVGHKEACSVLPPDAVLLASSPTCPVQMFRVRENLYATQFHPELDLPGIITRIGVYRDYGYFQPKEHDEVVALVREHFGPRLVRGRSPMAPRKGSGRVTGRPTLQLVNRDAEQTHLSIGVRTPGRNWDHRWALSVLNTALGGGLSSRLFQQIRETRGLAYSVYSTVDTFSDSGALSIYAGCQPERFDEVVRVTTEVLENVARDGITEAECRIAKGSLRGGLVLGLEDSGSRMNRIGRSELNYGEHRSIAHTLGKIDDVTLDEVNAVAHQLLTRPYGAAVLGPKRSKNSLPQPLRSIAG